MLRPSIFGLFYLSAILVELSICDIYFHNPRGSNDRLNTDSGKRRNGNRLFDSQNNAKGGYNVGEAGSERATSEDHFYRMVYFQSGANSGEDSLLTLEMYYQHGCGTDELRCDVIIQYMCQPESDNSPNWQMRDGSRENEPKFTPPRIGGESSAQIASRRQGDMLTSLNRGQQESWDSYYHCYVRRRNGGLWTADQRLRTNQYGFPSAVYTRQNPRGKQYGWECPEERDYYPYWHPTQWKDLLVWTDNVADCPSYLQSSFGGYKTLGVCAKTDGTRDGTTLAIDNANDCTSSGFRWVQTYNYLEKAKSITSEGACTSRSTIRSTYIWGVPYDAENFNTQECLVATPLPDCSQGPWAKANHLGLVPETQEFPRYEWTLPYFPSGTVQKCVLRARYNTTNSGDFNYKTADSSNNQVRPGEVVRKFRHEYRARAGEIRRWRNITWPTKRSMLDQLWEEIQEKAEEEIENGHSPVRQNPRVQLFPSFPEVALAINTDQTARVFQDRTHIFRLAPRPSEVPAGRTIYNLNVRGKRGNNVQVYNAVEYDFVPNNLTLTSSDLIHIQWTGGNHQVGDGEGRRGTDRSNIVQIADYGKNYPLYGDNVTMWKNSRVYWTSFQSPALFPNVSTGASPQMSRADPFSVRALSSRRSRFLRQILSGNSNNVDDGWHFADAHPHDIEKDLDDEPFQMRRKRQAVQPGTVSIGPSGLTDRELALALMTSGYYWCIQRDGCPSYIPDDQVLERTRKPVMNPQLDQAPASFPGVMLSLNRGIYYYMSTRNNKFTNRSQKGRILVS